MDHLTPELNYALTVFVWICGIALIALIFILGYLVGRVMKLIGSVDKLVETVNFEFTPTIKEIQTTLKHLSVISDKAEKHISEFSDTLDGAQKGTYTVFNQAKVGILSAFVGLTEGIKRLINIDSNETHSEKEIKNV